MPHSMALTGLLVISAPLVITAAFDGGSSIACAGNKNKLLNPLTTCLHLCRGNVEQQRFKRGLKCAALGGKSRRTRVFGALLFFVIIFLEQ